MKKLVPVMLAGFATIAAAGDTVVYTSDEYCALDEKARTQVDDQHVKAYAKKLGFEHSADFCKSLNKENKEEKMAKAYNAKAKWNYAFNKSERGSVRRLPARTVAKLKKAKIYNID